MFSRFVWPIRGWRSHSSPQVMLSRLEPRQHVIKVPKLGFTKLFHTPGTGIGASESVEPVKQQHVSLTEDVIAKLAAGDEAAIKRLKVIEFEYEVGKQEGSRVPAALTYEQWRELLILPTWSSRRKYLTFLFKKQMSQMNDQKKKLEQKIKRKAEKELEKLNNPSSGHIDYGMNRNTIFLKIYDSKIDHFYNEQVIRASCFDLPVVYDMGFYDHMNRIEQKNVAKQLILAFSHNREHRQPLPLQLCNARLDTVMMQSMVSFNPCLHQPESPISISARSYTDMFPKEKIVYLTPYCQTELSHFDPDSVYVIGAIVDKSNNEPLSFAKAKKEGIRMAKLPLDRYLDWGSSSSKCLTLNAMLAILLELRLHGDWDAALKHVPRRKLRSPENKLPDYSQLKYPRDGSRRISAESLLFPDVTRRVGPRKDVANQTLNINR